MVCVPHRPTRMWLALSIYPSLFWTMVMAKTTTRLISHWMSSSKWIAWTSIGPFPSLTTRVTHTHSTHPVGTSWIIITRAGQSSAVPWSTATTIFHFLAYCYYPTCLCLCEYIIRLNCPVASGRRPCRPTVSQAGLGATFPRGCSPLLSFVAL